MTLRDFTSPESRRMALEKEISVPLSSIGSSALPTVQANTKNCENMIGFAQIPMGVAGPLRIQGEDKEFYIPLATTEGALVASISRGCKVITQSGGAIVDSEKAGVTRGPVFKTESIEGRKKLERWLNQNKEAISEIVSSTSGHLVYSQSLLRSVSLYTFVRFVFDSKDAMGMNMATIASEKIAKKIEEETGIACLSVAGNFDIDKKPAWLNTIEGRGSKVWAEVIIPKEAVKNILKATPSNMYDVWLSKCMIGSALSGSIGFNSHFANSIAAIFLATGQDPAHVVEGSMGITIADVLENGDLYMSVYLPSLMIGTVGGGTQLPTQAEALQLLGVLGDGKVEKFSRIVAAVVLAGEISLLASLSQGSLGEAHQSLGRGK